MKKSALFIIALLLVFNIVNAQFEYGVRMGVSTQGLTTDENLLETNTFDELKIKLGESAYGYHFGVYGQVKAFGLTISPEVIFNSNTYNYTIQQFNEGQTVEKVLKDSYQYLDIPLLIGVKLGFLRAYAGPEVHYFVNSYSELVQEQGFNEQIEKVNYGGIIGAGLNLGRLRFDVRYEINFDDFEDHIFYQNNQLNFNSDDSRLIFSAGWKFN
jgi:hypothetical protein